MDIISERIERVVSSEGGQFSVYFKNSSDWMTQHSIARRPVNHHEPEVVKYLLRNLELGMTFLDVGAGVGWFTLIGAHEVGSEGRVLAYEPLPPRCELLKENVMLNNFENVQCFSLALSDRERKVYMTGHHLMQLTSKKTDIPVKTISLDSHFETLGLKQADVIKIDVEGEERRVLYGMEQTIKNNPQIKIICEIHDPIILGKESDKRLFHFMSELGFHAEELGGVPPHWVFSKPR